MPKLIRKLSEAQLRNAKPQQKPYRLNDEDGLRLLVRPSGTKVWQVPYKINGKSNVYTIGRYSHEERKGYIGSKEAREVRDEIKALVNQGIDPNKHKTAQRINARQKRKTTFEAIAREWHSRGPWVEGHALRIINSLEKNVFPHIGYKQINKVTRSDIVFVLSEIEKRGTLDTAKRIAQRCERILDYAIHRELCVNNVATGASRFIQPAPAKHRPHLKEHQLPEFLFKLNQYKGRDYVRLAMKLLVLTFVRPGELRKAPWGEIDRKKALWRIPAARMKKKRDHVVPLSKQTLAVLEELHKITGNSDYLFPGLHSTHKPLSDTALLKALKVMGYKEDKKITPHGFRHTACTILNENRFNADWIERQLAHVEKNKIRGTYNHAKYLDERAGMMQWWADHLDKLRESYDPATAGSGR